MPDSIKKAQVTELDIMSLDIIQSKMIQQVNKKTNFQNNWCGNLAQNIFSQQSWEKNKMKIKA